MTATLLVALVAVLLLLRQYVVIVLAAVVVYVYMVWGDGRIDNIVIDGWAPDGTPEAIYVADAPGFTLSVQWHPEWNAANDPVSRPLFQAFGDAVRDWAAR